MAKKLSIQQQKRINMRQANQTDDSANTFSGVVIARSKNNAMVETAAGKSIFCHLRRNLAELTVGDEVTWEPTADHGVILGIKPRKNCLTQTTDRNKSKSIAANIDHLIIVSALEPHWNSLLVDSFILIAELNGITPMIVINKIDLLNLNIQQQLDHDFMAYKDMGYVTCITSATAGEGIDNLKNHLNDTTSVIVGQSGVGKSSLTNLLIPNLDQQTSALTPAGLGSHTTSTATRFRLPEGGAIIDSPGIREFKFGQLSLEEIESGFKDFQPYLGSCKFNNCTHSHEPGCAIQEAATNSDLNQGRYQNFLSLCKQYLDSSH